MNDMQVIQNFPNYSIGKNGDVINNKTGKLLKVSNSGKKGYNVVSLKTENGFKTFYVHRLLAEQFIPNPEKKKTVNHKNLINIDNSLDNLEWSTYQENIQHAWDNGACTSNLLGNNISKSISINGVAYTSIADASLKSGVSKSYISRLLSGKAKSDNFKIEAI